MSVTKVFVKPLNKVVTSTSGAFTTTSTSFTAVTNLSIAFTPVSREVKIALTSDGLGSLASLSLDAAGGATMDIELRRDTVQIAAWRWTTEPGGNTQFLPSSLEFFDDGAGLGSSVTYDMRIKAGAGATTVGVRNSVLRIWEI